MHRISKFSVSQILSGISRQFAAKGGKGDKGGCAKGKGSDSKKGGGGKGDFTCASLKKNDLSESKKDGKDGKIEKCGGVPSEEGASILNMGGVGRKSSCQPKKPSGPKGSTAGTLRKVCLFGVLPGILLLNILILTRRTHEEREEFKKWPHLYKRDKRFPWGDGEKSFFHNPHTNPLPETGYEDDV